MRTGMVSALCVLLSLIYSPRPTAVQLNPAGPQLPQASLQKPPSPVKLSELPRGVESGDVGLSTDFTDERANVLRSLRNLVIQQEGASVAGIQSPVAASRCAHILIFQAPTVDSQMIKEAPRAFASNMPTFQGLQSCCRDFRSVMEIPQGDKFVSPGRIGALAPNPGMLLHGIRP